MTNILVVAELAEGKVKKSTHSAITFAKNVGAPFSILVIGQGAKGAAAEVAGFGAQKLLVCDDAYLVGPVCERFAPNPDAKSRCHCCAKEFAPAILQTHTIRPPEQVTRAAPEPCRTER